MLKRSGTGGAGPKSPGGSRLNTVVARAPNNGALTNGGAAPFRRAVMFISYRPGWAAVNPITSKYVNGGPGVRFEPWTDCMSGCPIVQAVRLPVWNCTSYGSAKFDSTWAGFVPPGSGRNGLSTMIANTNAGSPTLITECGTSGPPGATAWMGPNAAMSHQSCTSAISGATVSGADSAWS